MFKFYKNYGDKNFDFHKEDSHEINVIQFDEYYNHSDVIYDFLYVDVLNRIFFRIRNLEDCCDDLDNPLFLIIQWV